MWSTILLRESVFWLVVTFSRCMQIFAKDAPHRLRRFQPAYSALLTDIGIAGFDDLQRRADDVRRYLPTIWQVAEDIAPAS